MLHLLGAARRLVFAAAAPGMLGAMFLSLFACAGTRAGLDASNVYRDDAVAFKVGDVPATWRPVSVDAANLAYRDEARRASALVNGRCGRKDDDTPLVALTGQLLMGTTAREIASEETIPFDGREALHTRLTAKLDGVPLGYDVYVLKKDGCVYDLVYVGDPRVMEAGVPDFERFVSGFRTVRGGGEGRP